MYLRSPRGLTSSVSMTARVDWIYRRCNDAYSPPTIEAYRLKVHKWAHAICARQGYWRRHHRQDMRFWCSATRRFNCSAPQSDQRAT